MNPVLEARNQSGVSQTELARRSGVQRPNVVAYERGRRVPSWPVVERLVDAAGCRIVIEGRPRRENARSRRLGIAVAGKLLIDPEGVLALARQNLERLREQHAGGRVDFWLDRWDELLDGPLDAIVDSLVSERADAVDLRQVSPFAGALDDRERLAALSS